MFLAHFFRFLRQWRAYGNSLQELSRLGNRELADIGISRSDIPRIAWENAERAACLNRSIQATDNARQRPAEQAGRRFLRNARRADKFAQSAQAWCVARPVPTLAARTMAGIFVCAT
jgi:uncharacterized protein YjiS (DUF1127 family)